MTSTMMCCYEQVSVGYYTIEYGCLELVSRTSTPSSSDANYPLIIGLCVGIGLLVIIIIIIIVICVLRRRRRRKDQHAPISYNNLQRSDYGDINNTAGSPSGLAQGTTRSFMFGPEHLADKPEESVGVANQYWSRVYDVTVPLEFDLLRRIPAILRVPITSISTVLSTVHGYRYLLPDFYNKLEGTQRAQTSARQPSCMLWKVTFQPKLLLLAQSIGLYVGFGQDVLNHSRNIMIWRFSIWRFWSWTLILTSRKLIMKFGTDAEHLNQPTNKRTNEQTNQPTNKLAWPQYLLA